MELQDLKNIAAAGKIVIEEPKQTGPIQYIGFRLNRKNSFTYYWFSVHAIAGNELFFDHSYSQNTGKTSRSFSSAWNVLKSIGYFK